MRSAEVSMHGLPAGILEEVEAGKKFRSKISLSFPEKIERPNTTRPWSRLYPLSNNFAPFLRLKS